jgi:hypothetical protein
MIGWPNGLKKAYQIRGSFAEPEAPDHLMEKLAQKQKEAEHADDAQNCDTK